MNIYVNVWDDVLSGHPTNIVVEAMGLSDKDRLLILKAILPAIRRNAMVKKASLETDSSTAVESWKFVTGGGPHIQVHFNSHNQDLPQDLAASLKKNPPKGITRLPARLQDISFISES